jgi:hypothetical protein
VLSRRLRGSLTPSVPLGPPLPRGEGEDFAAAPSPSPFGRGVGVRAQIDDWYSAQSVSTLFPVSDWNTPVLQPLPSLDFKDWFSA